MLVTADFRGERIEPFIRILEQQTHLTFYYNPVDYDSFAVTMNVKAMPVEEVLLSAFRYTDYKASFDAEDHVFLTKGTLIVTQLPIPGNRFSGDSILNRQMATSLDRPGAKQSFANEKLYSIGLRSPQGKETNATVTVSIVSAKTKENIGASAITVDGKPIQIRDSTGIYTLAIPKGRHTLTVTSFGKRQAVRHLMIYGNGTLPVEMEDEIRVLEDVLVSTQKNTSVNRAQMGFEKLSIKSIKQVPAVFGEADVLRVILTLPGVKSVGEASTGFNVRGGGSDQNLILFNDATIYNPSHFFGFFSAFNPEVVKDVELYKSSIPVKYGGRLSSVLNITAREGDKTK
ncbi:MAG TPA: Plug domain-containing protein, partial [Segetibacter sp.]|nr:Plug domain-containing protein [Segetibacter sp.]